MDAVARGAADGMQMYLNIIPMLIVSLALVSLVNSALGNLMVGELPLSLQRLLGWVLSPVALAMGIPWAEASAAGQLIGTKLALNEVMAFLDLSRLPPGVLSAHSRLILAYALCGFANLGSIGILIGGIGTMVPERRHEIISMSSRSMLGGALSTCMSGTVVGLLS
jgi:CNT family concentrative nucleoside transporter